MRIRKIVVKGLFEMFDHVIPCNLQEHITIIHGPNGFGKTVLLTMLNALFNSYYHVLRRTPFTSFSLHFDDGSVLTVKKNRTTDTAHGTEEDRAGTLTFTLDPQDRPTETHTPKPPSRARMHFPLSILEREIAGLERIGPETWFYIPSQEKLSLEDVLERFALRLPYDLPERKKEPDWLHDIKASIDVRFIETQRLLSFSYSEHTPEYRGHTPMVPAVVNYSDELTTAIQQKLSEYASLSQSLDRTFPTRLVKGPPPGQPTMETLKTELRQLEEKRSRLMAAGLLDKEKEIDLTQLQDIEERNRNVLSVYIDDVKKKLSVFDELTNKIDVLVKIVNNRFLYKRLSISKKDGFVFTTRDGKMLSPTLLSSGEQHELVLLYELLFKVGTDSLILIDEPELSLHVVWQQQFLDDLQQIAQLSGFNVIIATHSPQIIHDRWDLTVQLKGPQNAPATEPA
jgi:predicted ATP-binding protein involved in virulence